MPLPIHSQQYYEPRTHHSTHSVDLLIRWSVNWEHFLSFRCNTAVLKFRYTEVLLLSLLYNSPRRFPLFGHISFYLSTVGTRFNDIEWTREFWPLNPNVVKSDCKFSSITWSKQIYRAIKACVSSQLVVTVSIWAFAQLSNRHTARKTDVWTNRSQ